MDKRGDLIKILIPAVGGQGGGVLTEWIIQAFILEGYRVQGIGLPGLSQRGGSTVYYIEAYPKPENNEKIIFSQYPLPGDVDVILCQEFLELGRMLEQGYGSSKTIIISSTHRIYSTREKLPIGSGIYSDENLRKLATAFSSRFIGLNALEIAKQNGLDELGINAILLGVLGACNALPISEASYLKSIEQGVVAATSNLRGFRIGWDHVKSLGNVEQKPTLPATSWDDFKKERADKLAWKKAEPYLKLISVMEAMYPERIREILAEALYRLIDYQDEEYARKFLRDIEPIYALDKEAKGTYKLTELFAKNLALWMTYEDGIRVAELKIKPERFKQIKQNMRIKENQHFRVIDYLKPDAEEIYGLLPYALVAPVLRLSKIGPLRRLWEGKDKMTFGQKPVTTSFLGFVRLWFLTKIKFMRPYSYRYHKEHSLIAKYRQHVEKAARLDYELGCLIAKAGGAIKGYGNVRRRTMDAFSRFLENIVDPLAEYEKANKKGFSLTLGVAEKSLGLIGGDSTDGIEKAEKLASDVLSGKAA